MWKLISLVIVSACLVLAGAAACAAAGPVTLQTGEPDVTAGIRLEGATVPFWGQVPAGCDVVLKAQGPLVSHSVRTRRDEGIELFPSVVSALPSVYQILSSVPLDEIPDTVKQEAGIDPQYDVLLRTDIRVFDPTEPVEEDGTGGLSDLRIKQAIKQSVDGGWYGHFEDAVEVEGGRYSGTLYLPGGRSLKDIRLTVYAVRDGRIVAAAEHRLDIPVRYFTRPYGETPEERILGAGIIFLSCVVLSLTALQWLQKGKASPAARK